MSEVISESTSLAFRAIRGLAFVWDIQQCTAAATTKTQCTLNEIVYNSPLLKLTSRTTPFHPA